MSDAREPTANTTPPEEHGERAEKRTKTDPACDAQIVVVAKEPVPGLSKTRLTPPYTQGQAAGLAEAALGDTLAAVADVPVRRRVIALEGTPGPWLPPGFEVTAQRGDGLDERLAAVFDDAYADLPAPVLVVGMDTPQVTGALLQRAVHELAATDAVFGPATDGGFWLLGLRDPDGSLLAGVPMSTRHTGRAQLRRLRRAGLRVSNLPELTDVDTHRDVQAVAAHAPGTRFAKAAAELRPGGNVA